ncbi:MAG: alpha/beta hydrolase [Chromatiales bacterium]|jgi:pimeloyl-ACP methyl ester carboxylesterase|nr:alpha/beta hydrolase [Chromatiales bacterium]
MALGVPGPTSHTYFSQRLRLHYVDWGNKDAPPMLLVHGGRDHCRNWDWVAQEFCDDYHIIAPDLRGHGDSQWMIGGNYSHLDYVYDIAQLLHQTKFTPVTIIAHSLGGSITLTYTGLYPQSVKKLVAIEGLGQSPERRQQWNDTPVNQKATKWIDALRKMSGRVPRRYATLQEAFERMHQENPHLNEDQARHLTIHGSNQNEDGTYSWKFDNYTRSSAPLRLSTEESTDIHGRIECPTLLIRGTESWASDPTTDGRLAQFRNASVAAVDEAGHWVHHDQLDYFCRIVRDFLRP